MSQTDELVTEIDAVRAHLSDTIDELVRRVHPRSLARSGADSLKSRFVDETGTVRAEAVLPIVGAVAGVIALGVVVRRILR